MKINPKQLEKIAKQMGMQAAEIAADEVIIRAAGKDIIIANPQVTKINMMGQETYQTVGTAREMEREEIQDASVSREDDIKLVMAQTGKGRQAVEKALEESNGDIAEAIMRLKK